MRHKVAHVTSVDMSLRYLLLRQLESLKAEGYDVVGVSTPGHDVPAIEARGIRHVAITIRRNVDLLQDLRSLWRLYRLFRREGYSIVHAHNPKPGLLAQIAAKAAGVPVIVNTLHGFYFHDHMRPAQRRFLVALEKVAARCSDRILSQNREDIATALREHICKPELIDHLGNGIDLAEFSPDRFPEMEVRSRRAALGIPEEARVVGFVGRLAARRKGFRDFLMAGQRVAARCPELRFLIVGESDRGKPDSVDPSQAAHYGIADKCLFLGKRANDELPLLYRCMDVLVLPSLFEGMPRVIMECSAMGVPAVATDVKGNREAIVHGRNGLLVPLGDVPALSDAIFKVLSDPAEADRMGREGRRLAAERFDERLVFEKVKTEYRRLLTQKGLPASSAEVPRC
jgi:glycosyltransferase involved in cell wall biosynthesis